MSQDDRRRLAAIEEHLVADDPDYVRRVRRLADVVGRGRRFRALRGGSPLLWGAVALAVVLLVVGILAAAPGSALTGTALLATVLWARRLRRRR
jgi:hypothetical protein